jgi:hypothetical protein
MTGRDDRSPEDVVLICRCAWHRRYQGYPRLSGVASWRGWNVRFTDGICDRCLQRFRAEHQRYLERRTEARATPSVAPTTASA